MIEIIIALIIQITTIVNGGITDKEKAEQKAKEEKAKTEQTSGSTAAEGGSGTWND